MKIRMKIRSKLMLAVLLVTSITYALSIGYLIFKLQDISLREAFTQADLSASESANLVRANLNHDMDISRAIAHAMHNFREIPEPVRPTIFKEVIHGIAYNNPDILSVWGSWELNALDSTYTKPYGRHRITYYRENGELKFQEATMNLDGDDIGSSYHSIKLSKQETMIDPYWFSYTEDSEPLLEASTAVPLLEDGVFRGLFGMDIVLHSYQTLTTSIRP
ncbi:MAG: cache domain-containing protein, partial [Bacteroidales bacterium]|nr:cache domain-containing protein [Bacteroidales bacterium]